MSINKKKVKKGKQINLNQTIDNLRKHKLYLIKVQEEQDVKTGRLDKIHCDLIDEYNKLLSKGHDMYSIFFETFYRLKLKNKKTKNLFTEDEIDQFKRFLTFKKIKKNYGESKVENPLYKIVECDSKFQNDQMVNLNRIKTNDLE